MAQSVVWRGLDEPRMEIAHIERAGAGARARGTQIGLVYELRYELEPGLLTAEVVGGERREFRLDGDFFDLGNSPLFNSLPVWRDGVGAAHDYVMTWVSVPELDVRRSEQRYEPLGDGRLRYRSGSFSAELELDKDGVVTRYPGLAERMA
jgi:hypothetical protein